MFDVELLSRLHRGSGGVSGLPASAFLEVPLNEWRDVQRHEARPAQRGPSASLDLVRIAVRPSLTGSSNRPTVWRSWRRRSSA